MLLGEIFVKRYAVDPRDVERGIQFQEKYGGLIGSVLLNMGIISEDTLVAALAEQLDLKLHKDIDTERVTFSFPEFQKKLNFSFLTTRQWLPLFENGSTLVFAARNPLEYEVIQYLQSENITYDAFVLTESEFRALEGEYNLVSNQQEMADFEDLDMVETEVDKLKELASEAPVVNLVNSFISRAIGRGASDLHFEPFKNMYRVRFRIDGILHDVDFLPHNMQLPISSRIKILSGMDIAERRRPQDGQISMKVASSDIDIRVSTLPLAKGESLVLRFLVAESVSYELDHLGLESDLISYLSEDISKTGGVILITGPTGSGKTTTLYSSLNKINDEDKKIITIEDPVEYQLDGINQIQVQAEIDYDFLKALRSILRQDPDVIMVGEIRDGETARVAMQSSLTGHLVFSTLHTNDAPTAYTRLIDLGIEEFLINSSLISVIAQRLVRRLCPECSRPVTIDEKLIGKHKLDELARKYGVSAFDVREPEGCPLCNQTGYRGRVGIMEYLRCTDAVKMIPKDSLFPSEARKYMKDSNIRTLLEDGLLKVIKGVTSFDEVFRVCG